MKQAKRQTVKTACLFLCQPLQPHSKLHFSLSSGLAFGGKNDSLGKSTLLNTSHGSSLSGLHSLRGIQKSYDGIIICTFLSSCVIVKIPIVALTLASPVTAKSSPKYVITHSGIGAQGSCGTLPFISRAERAIGSEICTVAFGKNSVQPHDVTG